MSPRGVQSTRENVADDLRRDGNHGASVGVASLDRRMEAAGRRPRGGWA
jgi:hypothetical protein